VNITELNLDSDQRAALDLATSRSSVFVTGAAGSGKSALMRVLIDKIAAEGRTSALTASTGIAALNISGRTIHSFLGTKICGSAAEAEEHLCEMRQKEPERLRKIKWRLAGTDVLVVDEVSMLTGDYVDMIDWWLRELLGDLAGDERCDASKPFAGKQLVFVGDFFQLPPVITRDDRVERELAFQARAWRAAGVRTAMLTHNHRQESDQPFKDALDSLRTGRVSPEAAAYFDACVGRDIREPTVLFPTNEQVARVNAAKLAALPGSPRTLTASFSGPAWAQKQLARLCFTEKRIRVKEGAEVILTRNVYEGGDDDEGYFVNGDRGVITDLDGSTIRVRLERDDGREVGVRREQFELRSGANKVVATMTQFPIKLAYALSIHKSQGMTLPRVACDLGRCFAEGQAYTALSRARTAEGLSLKRSLSQRSVFADPRCVAFYEAGGRLRFVGRRRRAAST
jgi:ATP-dependent exoDNAse (exonuclease V) alpha subunit